MIRMMTSALALAAMTVSAAAQCSPAGCPSAPPAESGMVSLFNGKDLAGWDGDPQLWTVKDGVIRGETTEELKSKGNTFLICSKGNFKDFELRLSYRLNASNNSGIQYRSQRVEKAANNWVVRGYQHEIRNENVFPNVSGFIYSEGGITGKGRICLCGEKAVRGEDDQKTVTATLINNEEYKKLFNLDGWNDVVIIAKGNHIQHFLNGRLILDFTDNSPKALKDGVIALQLHGGKPMWTEYKNIRIKEL
jgi:hypothetical protein